MPMTPSTTNPYPTGTTEASSTLFLAAVDMWHSDKWADLDSDTQQKIFDRIYYGFRLSVDDTV